MKFFRLIMAAVTIWLMAFCGNGEAALHASSFSGNGYYRYMQRHQGSRYKTKRLRAMRIYFQRKNPQLSRKRAANYAALVTRVSRKYRIDPFIIAALIVKESTANWKAVSSPARSYGLMQVNWKVHKKWIPKKFPRIRSRKALMKPANNVRVGTYILHQALKRRGNSVDGALDAYRGRRLASYRRSVLRHYVKMAKIFKEL